MEFSAVNTRELTDAELDAVAGGETAQEAARQEAQILQTLADAVSAAMKGFGEALQSAARGA